VAPALQLRQLRKVRRNPRASSIGQLVSVWLEIKVTRARESPFRGSNNILMIKFIFEKAVVDYALCAGLGDENEEASNEGYH